MAFRAIHCADIHLGSRMEAKLPKEKADRRREELRETFSRTVRFAREHAVPVILLPGDVFDSDSPLKKEKVFFYDIIKANPEIEFFYLRGNHDSRESYTEQDIPNLKTFGKEWTYYERGDTVIGGIELAPENALSLYSTLRTDPDKRNILLMHGQISESAGSPGKAEPGVIYLPRLREKNIDYLALGHLHSFRSGKLDDRGMYAYSGCLEGRGFDETGEKGFVLLEADRTVCAEFVPFAGRSVREVQVDVTGMENLYRMADRIRLELRGERENLVRVLLSGEIGYETGFLAQELERLLAPDFYYVSVKDKTRRKADPDAPADRLSLRGEFIRIVTERTDLDEDRKQEILSAGLRALSGQEVE